MGSIDRSYQLLAARYVGKQVARLSREMSGAQKAKGVERVHQARVASRRLRAALRMFRGCFPGRKPRRWRKEIGRLTKGLGPARDADVQIEFVREFMLSLEDRPCRPGVRRLLVRLRQQRKALQPKVVKAVDRTVASGVLRDMAAAAKAFQSLLEGRDVSIWSPFVFLRAERLILRRLEKVLTLQDCLADPAEVQRHHEMRIATKRLRYTMEICKPIYEGRLDEFVDEAKAVQTLLGEIHDCDVWMGMLPAFMEAERSRTLAYYGTARPFHRLAIGLEHLREERRQQRYARFAELTEHWQDLSRRGVWDRLAGMVVSCVQQSVRSEPPAEPPAEATPEPCDEATPEAPEAEIQQKLDEPPPAPRPEPPPPEPPAADLPVPDAAGPTEPPAPAERIEPPQDTSQPADTPSDAAP